MVKKFSLMVILAVILTLGLAANGLAGGALEPNPPDPAAGEHLKGPAIVGHVMIEEVEIEEEDALEVTFTGRCGGTDVDFMGILEVASLNPDFDEAEDFADGRIGPLSLVPDCFSGDGELIIKAVIGFTSEAGASNFDAVILAVVIRE